MYRPEIDGLRCFAVLAVLMFHFDFFPNLTFNPFKGGYIGVDVFFVISGYVITQSITNSLANGSFSFLNFYKSRVKRLFPAIITTLVLCYLFGYFFLYSEEFNFLARNALYSMAFIQNINLSEGAGYFSGEAEVNLLLHFWSLSVEEQFYLFFPALMIFLYKYFKKENHVIIISALVLLGYTYSNWMSDINPNENFYLIQSRFFQLLLGTFVFYLRNEYNELVTDNVISNVLSLFGLFLVAHYIVFGGVKSQGPNVEMLMPLIGITISLLTLSKNSLVGKVLCWRPFSLLGLISYEIYLLHFPLISGLTIYFGGMENISLNAKLIALALCLFTSLFVHFKITNKIRYDNYPFRSWLGCIIAYLFVALLFVVLIKSDGVTKGSFAKKNVEIGNQLEGPIWQYANNQTCLDKYAPENYKDYGWFFCYLEEDKEPEVLIIGNSFANHWVPMIENAEPFKRLNVISYGNNSIDAYFNNAELKESTNKKQRVTYATGEVIKKELLTKETIDYIVVTQNGFTSKKSIEALKEVRKMGDFKIIVILPHAKPQWNEVDTAACFSRPFSDIPEKCNMLLSDMKEVFPDKEKVKFKSLVSQLDEVYVFDPNVGYCNGDSCDFTKEGKPVFRDVYHHVSVHGNSLVQPFFEEFLESQVGKGK
ncbi:hypothetical protein BCU71_02965 [Vibrio lentus]|nr:hypothetical protein BCU71_02965 [Vibrio lentus]PMK70951.1 hypothetical protein BCT93_00680 [Vibrio lentus]